MKKLTKNTNKNILCIRPDGMGDVLMTTPAFRALKDTFPDVGLSLLTSPSGGAIAQFIPEIDEIITVNVPWEKMDTPSDSSELLALIQFLKQKKFDHAIIFTTFSQNPLLSALLCYLADIPQRLAYSSRKPYALLTDWIVDQEPGFVLHHEVERQLTLVKKLGAVTKNKRLSLRISQDAKRSVLSLLALSYIDRNNVIVVHPGASSLKRRYSPSGFAEIIHGLSDMGYQVVCTGNADEVLLINEIILESQTNAKSLAGQLSLGEFIALLDDAALVISNNTGAVHIAAAVVTPVVDLYALTNPQHTPWMVPSSTLYFPVLNSFKDDIVCADIPQNAQVLESPQQVVEKAIQLIKQTSNQHRIHYEKDNSPYTNI